MNCPEGGLCTLDERAAYSPVFACQKEKIICSDNYGTCFYSKYIDKIIPFTYATARRISDFENFQKMIIFDHIIYNKDRHFGNILFDASMYKFYPIDHSHVFKNQTIWDKCCFEQGIEDNDYNDKHIITSNFDTYDSVWVNQKYDYNLAIHQAENIAKILTPSLISDIIKQVPSEWTTEIPREDIECLNKYINYRIAHLKDIVLMIYKAKEEKYHDAS